MDYPKETEPNDCYLKAQSFRIKYKIITFKNIEFFVELKLLLFA